MQDDSKLTLNNVNISGNSVEDDDGAGIAVYDGATLIMNGGSISDNSGKSVNVTWIFGVGVYVEDSTASFYNVTFKNNNSGGRASYDRDQSETYSTYGTAIYAEDSNVILDSCRVYDNAQHRGNFHDAESVIGVIGESEMTVKNTIFRGNGGVQHFTNGKFDIYLGTKLFNMGICSVTVENCQFIGNSTTVLFDAGTRASLSVSNTNFTDNTSSVYYCRGSSSGVTSFTDCTFDKNRASVKYPYSFQLADNGNQPTFIDCNFGNSSFNDRSRATIVDNSATNGAGSIFGEGSLAMIIAVLALVVSIASLGISFANKKKSSSAAENNEE